uniref:Uncharacterized protein n=1 Tax=Magnetococcus massalia (strain MO-1) TaxID=451514 RepID=A0A1S7LE32_MAGMO|nr:Conserved hypothetical protein [Candidatus Magnetococcus massalia]
MIDERMHELVVKSVVRLLRPLVRLLLEHGITHSHLSELLKGIYVDVANRDMPLEGKRQTLSRISLISGVHRKDVKRLLEAPENPVSPRRSTSLGARLYALWLGDPRYLDAAGKPRPLPRQGALPSFESLVTEVNTDLRPRSVLDEWLRIGLVTVDDQQRLVLNREALLPQDNFEDKLYFFSRNLRDHLAAGGDNLIHPERPPHLDRAVFYDQLTAESVEELRLLSRQQAIDSLHAINKEALKLAERDATLEGADHRFTYGVYFYQEQESPSESTEDDKA